MANTTYSIVLRESGYKAFIVPEGFQPSVEIHCWGAGGGTGWGGAPGGGGGYAKTIVNVSPGDEITLQIGQPGQNATSATSAGLGGVDSSNILYRGGNGGARGTWCGQTKGPFPSGGGGGASWVAVNFTTVCVGAGGGGGGGYGHDNVKYPGSPGGVYSGLTNSSSGQDAAYGGGGGAGYQGGVSGFATGHVVTGGNGGRNFGNVTIAGSGILPGGQNIVYYPGDKIGNAGFPGYIVIILTKKLNILIKNPNSSNNWVNVESLYYKLPTQTTNIERNFSSQTISFTTVGLSSFTVPTNVTSLTIRASGGGGGGGGSDGGDSNHNLFGRGGSASNLQTLTLAVRQGDVISMSIGGGGGGAGPGYAAAGGGGTTTISRNGTSVLSVAGGAGGLSRQSSAGPFPGEVSSNGGSNGGNGSAAGYRSSGSNGQAGKVIISYTPNPITITTVTGGWKPVQQVFTKVSGSWKPILTNRNIPLTNGPTRRIKANISIIANTNDYNLFNNLPGTYIPGLMDIDVWVFPNVVITGNTTSTAFTISGFAQGDRITLRNYGYLAGRGGQGGNGGYSYTQNKTTYVATATAGGSGGTGLLIANPTILINNGNIAGGGGGGGGGRNPGGRGGGGAGFGVGFNNGTLTSGGAGQNTTYDGGNGGSRGQPGGAGQNGAPGGAAGFAIQGVLNLVPGSNVGAYFGPLG